MANEGTVQLPTMIETGNSGNAWGAGLGAFVGSVLGNGGFGGWGGWNSRGMAPGQGVADVSLANAIEHVSDQVTQGTIAGMQQGYNSAEAITGAITQGTFAGMQNTQNISEKLCGINNNITTQGYENRVTAQGLTLLVQNSFKDLSHQVFEEGCKNRELQREIATQELRDKYAKSEAENAALKAQINLTQQLTNQTAYIIQQLGTAIAARSASTANG